MVLLLFNPMCSILLHRRHMGSLLNTIHDIHPDDNKTRSIGGGGGVEEKTAESKAHVNNVGKKTQKRRVLYLVQ